MELSRRGAGEEPRRATIRVCRAWRLSGDQLGAGDRLGVALADGLRVTRARHVAAGHHDGGQVELAQLVPARERRRAGHGAQRVHDRLRVEPVVISGRLLGRLSAAQLSGLLR